MTARKLRPYPAYKDSGVEWLGEVPASWDVKPLKHVANFVNGFAFKPDEWGLQGTPIIRIENLNGGQDFNCTTRELPGKYFAAKGDLLFGWSGNRGTSFGPFLWWRDGTHYVNQHIFHVTDFEVDTTWLYWTLRGVTFYVEKQAHGIIGMVHVTRGELGSIAIPIPPPQEQERIAAFLDRETAMIDALVGKKERLIELLQEQRTALITSAVTKGLDPNVPMKDSGVEWLAEIPGHWEVKKVKRLCLVRRGASPRPIDDPIYFDDEGEYAWVRIADVTSSERYLERTTQRLSALGKSKSVALEPGELFVSIAATVGKPIITKIRCCIHDGFVYFVGLHANREFLFYVFSCGEPYKGLGKLGTQLNLNTDTIGDIHLPRPSDAEQEEVVQFLDRETARIDALVAKVRDAIDRLVELRTAVISAAVTGKIDVREEVA